MGKHTPSFYANRAGISGRHHTPNESLEVGPSRTELGHVRDGKVHWVATISFPSTVRAKQDCERLAACWNACAGIPTEQLGETRCVERLVKEAKRLLASIEEGAPFYTAELRFALAPFQKESD